MRSRAARCGYDTAFSDECCACADRQCRYWNDVAGCQRTAGSDEHIAWNARAAYDGRAKERDHVARDWSADLPDRQCNHRHLRWTDADVLVLQWSALDSVQKCGMALAWKFRYEQFDELYRYDRLC